MIIEQKVIVLHAERYDYTKKDTGEKKTGCMVTFIEASEPKQEDDAIGWKPEELKLPYGYFEMIDQVPGLCTLTVDLVSSRDGRSMYKVAKSVKFVTGVEFAFEVDALAQPMTPALQKS